MGTGGPAVIRGAAAPLLAVAAAAVLAAAQTAPSEPPDEEQLRRAVVLHGLALAEMEDGSYLEAIGHLEKVAAILPDNLLPHVNLAICHFRAHDAAQALASITRARQLAPDNPQVLFTLARILEERPEAEARWREILERFAAAHPFDPRPAYLQAVQLVRRDRPAETLPFWEQALELAPDNLVLMVGLLRGATAARDAEGTSDALYAIEDRLGGFEGPAAAFAARLRVSLDRGETEELAVPGVVIGNILRPSILYQIGLDELEGRGRPAGPMFPQLDFVPPLPRSVQGGRDIEVRFRDDTAGTGADLLPGARVAPARSPGRDDFLVVGRAGVSVVDLVEGRFRSRRLPGDAGDDTLVLRLDVDQDGVNDLVLADARRGVRMHRGTPGSEPETPAVILAPSRARGLALVRPLDLDHEGDLDLLVGRAGATDLYLRNDGDGTWTEEAAALGIQGPEVGTTCAATADFDDDGDLDLLVCHGEASPRLYLNRRGGPLADATGEFRLDTITGAHDAIAVDFTNDGLTDLLLWGPAGGRLLVNEAGFEFRETPLPEQLASTGWTCAAAADLDNDGDVDVVACLAGEEERLVFARNRGGALSVEDVGLPRRPVRSVLAGDLDADGDLDLVATGPEGKKAFLRNDGGNRNHYVRLTLRGKNDNNAKNNTQGLFARIETRAGGAYQATLGNGGVNHLGLGSNLQAEVLRVVWTNGLPQTWRLVAADRTMDEAQVLKGSCPFLYAWNGSRFEFVTDLMWTSPLGMLRDDGSRATHLSARDLVKIPAAALQPSGRDLWLQVTEELWETIYLDRAYLLAVDHPADVEMLVDETFRQPRDLDLVPIHWVDRRLVPVEAVDHRGRDVLDRIRRRDGVHVDQLPLTRYQGLTEGHHLELTFAGVPADERLRLLLWGWIFPTDTSINRALSQNDALAQRPPRLEIRRADGTWRTLLPSLSVPNGKRKSMVVDLTGRLPAGRVTVRIATNLQIYWDAAALAVGDPAIEPAVTQLIPTDADLHYRGYSRLYRETPTGPHLFDYAEVSTAVRFRDMTGAFTRYGPVEELLREEDDRYVVMNAGDEVSLRFDAGELPPLPPGWVRDWALYTDGWVKDADINTVFSASVDPLPYHGMTAYPDRPAHRYPATPEHRYFLSRYQTRWVSDRPFRDALKPAGAEEVPSEDR